jgi:hypothetical protein
LINYKHIHDSIEFYSIKYTRIEVPWLVSDYVDSITRPEGTQPYQVKHNKKNLVASAEQSFLYLYLKNFLPIGKFQAVTPCFRSGDSFDYTHSKYFIKNELIQTDIVNGSELEKMVELASSFFSKYFGNINIIKTENGFDINWKEYELGSYGIRECEFLQWIYGTACAEPRMSRIIKLKDNKI